MSNQSNTLKYWILSLGVGITVVIVSHYIITGNIFDKTPAPAKTDTPSLFTGAVGNWTAYFTLTFDYPNKTIHGTYSYPNRPGVIYKIEGTILGNDVELIEYTDNRVSARCSLHTDDRICFTGTMNNTDGRRLSMNFCKTKSIN